MTGLQEQIAELFKEWKENKPESAAVLKCVEYRVTVLLDSFFGSEELLEALAKLEHDQWASWLSYQISLLRRRSIRDGSKLWTDWRRKAETPYDKLTEKEKESDRVLAKKVLELFK